MVQSVYNSRLLNKIYGKKNLLICDKHLYNELSTSAHICEESKKIANVNKRKVDDNQKTAYYLFFFIHKLFSSFSSLGLCRRVFLKGQK